MSLLTILEGKEHQALMRPLTSAEQELSSFVAMSTLLPYKKHQPFYQALVSGGEFFYAFYRNIPDLVHVTGAAYVRALRKVDESVAQIESQGCIEISKDIINVTRHYLRSFAQRIMSYADLRLKGLNLETVDPSDSQVHLLAQAALPPESPKTQDILRALQNQSAEEERLGLDTEGFSPQFLLIMEIARITDFLHYMHNKPREDI
jgi:hypothetical protein